jgi:hypothetical protein
LSLSNANTTAADPTAAAMSGLTNQSRWSSKTMMGPQTSHLAESSAPTIPDKASTAHIYIQEDDAEFQDYDEEDPDDDLDI